MEIAQQNMRAHDLKLMSIDELLSLREMVDAELGVKIAAEKAELNQALRKLGLAGDEQKLHGVRRFHPKASASIEIRKTTRRPGLDVESSRVG